MQLALSNGVNMKRTLKLGAVALGAFFLTDYVLLFQLAPKPVPDPHYDENRKYRRPVAAWVTQSK